MALGATQQNVQLGVLAKTLRMTAIGIAAGTIASLAVSSFIATLLFGTKPTDPAHRAPLPNSRRPAPTPLLHQGPSRLPRSLGNLVHPVRRRDAHRTAPLRSLPQRSQGHLSHRLPPRHPVSRPLPCSPQLPRPALLHHEGRRHPKRHATPAVPIHLSFCQRRHAGRKACSSRRLVRSIRHCLHRPTQAAVNPYPQPSPSTPPTEHKAHPQPPAPSPSHAAQPSVHPHYDYPADAEHEVHRQLLIRP